MKMFSECCEPCCPGETGEQAEQRIAGQGPPGSRLVSGTIAQQGEPRYLEPLVQVGDLVHLRNGSDGGPSIVDANV